MRTVPHTELKPLQVRKTVITDDNRVFFKGKAHVTESVAKQISREERKRSKTRPYQEVDETESVIQVRTDESDAKDNSPEE